MQNIRVGFVGVTQLNFDRGLAGRNYAAALNAMRKLAKQWGFDLIAEERAIVTREKMRAFCQRLAENRADMLLLQNTSFASGELCSELAFFAGRHTVPVLIWGIPEPTGGPLRANSFCCANFYASILRSQGVPFKWLVGAPADKKRFLAPLQNSFRAVKTMKALHAANVGLVGSGRVPGFYGSNFDEMALKERFGLNVDCVDLSTLFAAAAGVSKKQVRQEVRRLRARVKVERMPAEEVERSVSAFLALKQFAEEARWAGIALRCWPEFFDSFGAAGCAALGMLNEAGIVASDESDIWGLLSMLASHYATDGEGLPTLLDMVSFDEDKNTVGMWHCGGSSPKVARGECRACRHSLLAFGPQGKTMGVVFHESLKTGPVTLLRFAGVEGDMMFLTEGRMIATRPSFQGAYGDIRLPKTLPVADLVNTLMVHGCEHHYSVAWTHHAAVLEEMAYWMDLERMPILAHQDGRGAFADL